MTVEDHGYCAKADCQEKASMLVELHDPTGDLSWWSCPEHAWEFEEWVFRQSLDEGESAESVFASADGSLLEIKVIGSQEH